MTIKKPSLALNIDDPEDKKLFDFVTKLPNGKKRNQSKFLRTLVVRAYQEYERENAKKATDFVSRSTTGGIKYTMPNQLND
jgi:hypothetical protein